jgi:hypothetical protein
MGVGEERVLMGLLDELRLAKEIEREADKEVGGDWNQRHSCSGSILRAVLPITLVGLLVIIVFWKVGFERLHEGGWEWAVVWAFMWTSLWWPVQYDIGFWAQRNRPLGSPLRTAVFTWIAWPRAARLPVLLAAMICLIYGLSRRFPRHGVEWPQHALFVLVIGAEGIVITVLPRVIGAAAAARAARRPEPGDSGKEQEHLGSSV